MMRQTKLIDWIKSVFYRLWHRDAKPTPLFILLKERIDAHGPLSLEAFMQTALHHPIHGYYRSTLPVGRDGDFSTGPEESQMFGEMFGVWCHETWVKMGRPDPFILLELGPGRGTLMHALLTGTQAAKDFHKAMRLYMMESSAPLRAMQQGRLLPYNPTYIERMAALPALPMIVIGNEFFDTFPLRQFVKKKKGWHERMVGLKRGRLVVVDAKEAVSLDQTDAQHTDPCLFGTTKTAAETTLMERPALQQTPPKAMSDFAPSFPLDVPSGFVYEISPQTLSLTQEIATHISQHGGAGLLVDYGYDDPPGEDSLFAFRHHHYRDILHRPGQTDVTGDVDFAAIRRVLRQNGLSVEGPIGQGELFVSLGIRERAEMIVKHSPQHADKVHQELFRLTSPSVMGEWFKALQFGRF